ncbi:MAG: hypothetical protein GSR78_05435 [Desulfurococcales archaeon]|nr:hypothetical protein [Desulfurococcales archaeon]
MMAYETRTLVAIVLAAVIIGAAGYSLGALAHGGSGPSSQPVAAPGVMPGAGMGMGGGMMGGMMGNGMMGGGMGNMGPGGQAPMAQPGGMGMMDDDHDGMMCSDKMMEEMHEMMEYGMMDDGMATVSIQGTIVGGEDGLLLVDTGDGIVEVKMLPVYVDDETGYLVSGLWLQDRIAGATGSTVTIEGVGSGDFVVAWEIDAEGLGSYTSMMSLGGH